MAKPGKNQPPLDSRQKAIKYKAFQHTFSIKDLGKNLNEKWLLKKLKSTQEMEQSYKSYLTALEKDPSRAAIFPWNNPLRRFLFLLMLKGPGLVKWCLLTAAALLIVNYIPGPTQHICEFMLARAIYDTANIQRLPETLETYGHSANIVDARGQIIKSYGKRQVTQQIPNQVRRAILACEDRYLLPHPNNPWQVNAFLVHAGVSWINLFGAVKDTLHGQARGASTIIMQNAKKILANEKRTITKKLEEIIVSYMLVAKFGKAQNLDFYINTVPVGSNMYGFQAAAQNYFKKDLGELNMQQLVAIGAFIPNHNRQLAFYQIVNGQGFAELSPSRRAHAKSAVAKVNQALAYLREMKEISPEEYTAWRLSDEESIRGIGFRDYHSPLYGEEEWTSWNVIKELCSRGYTIDGRKVSGEKLMLEEKGDVVVETGVDVVLIEKIKQVIREFLTSKTYRQVLRKHNQETWRQDLAIYQKRNLPAPYANFEEFMTYLYRHINVGVMIVNQWGEIVAQIGGKDFFQDNSGTEPAPVLESESKSKKTERRSEAAGLEEEMEMDGPLPENSSAAELPEKELVAANPDKKPELAAAEKEPEAQQRVIIDLMNKNATITPASTIKPIIAYYSMVTGNANLDTEFPDNPLEYKYIESVDQKVWLPRNWYRYDAPGTGKNHYLGRNYSLLEAQVLSVNTIFARLYNKRPIRSAMLINFDRIGLQYNKEEAKYWPFGIGSSNVPVQQWLGIYNAFLDGYYREPAFVKRILVNGRVIYERQTDSSQPAVMLFDAKKERDDEMLALYKVCSDGSGATLKKEFQYNQGLISGKTGTAPSGSQTLFVSHFNPYRDRTRHADKNMTMIVTVTTNTGGHKSVGMSTQGPTQVAGLIYNYLFQKELREMLDITLDEAKKSNIQLRNNQFYLANINRYTDKLLNDSCNNRPIHEYIAGVDGFQEGLAQILNTTNQIYTGKDALFQQLVDYYCTQNKLIK